MVVPTAILTRVSLSLLFFLLSCPLFAEKPLFFFRPPKGWNEITPRSNTRFLVGFLSDQKKSFVPSLTISMEKTNGISAAEYAAHVKRLYLAKRRQQITELGPFKTQSGEAQLLQVDIEKHWGPVVIFQAFLQKDEEMFILTGVCSKEDYSQSCKDFFESFASFRWIENPLELIQNPLKKESLIQRTKDLKTALAAGRFEDKSFQKNHWKPFEKHVQKQFQELGPYFCHVFLEWTKKDLVL